jgi:acetylglutamate kinase
MDTKLDSFRQMVKAEGLLVLKCSGKTLGDEALERMAGLKGRKKAKNLAIVHGGGIQITNAMKSLGMEVRFHNGYRVTDAATMEVVEQELVKINRGIVERLRRHRLETAPFLYGVFHGNTMEEATGRYGYITRMECLEVAYALLDGKTAVLAPIGTDAHGGKLNLNADDAAVAAAMALGASDVILTTDVDGIFAEGRLIPEIQVSQLEELMEARVVNGGMIAKARACIQAANAGVSVRIVNGNSSEAVGLALEGNACGTVVLPAGR